MSRDQMLSDLAVLRDKIEQARQRVADLEADRDDLMLAADAASTPVTWIVRSAGVDRSRFYQVKAARAREV